MPTLQCNSRRIIRFSAILQSGVFAPYYVDDDSIATFDLSGMLRSGETLTGIVSFVLIPEGPSPNNLDTTPTERIVSGPEVSGSLVNVELGNWQTDPRLVQYAAKLVFSTNYEPAQTVLGIVQVIQLAPYPQNPPCIDGCHAAVFPIFSMPWDF